MADTEQISMSPEMKAVCPEKVMADRLRKLDADIQRWLDNPDEFQLEWVDPWKGTSVDGKTENVPVLQRATVRHCLKLARHAAYAGDVKTTTEHELLVNFMLVNWAHLYDPYLRPAEDMVVPEPVFNDM